MQRILIILIFSLFGCGTTSNTPATKLIGEKNKDVLILSTLIRDHLRQTKGREINLHELVQNDSLKRISNNFEGIVVKSHGGYMSVSYRFSASRNSNVELTSKEEEMLNWMKWASKDLSGQYDGEIRFNYGERFYNIRQIIVKI